MKKTVTIAGIKFNVNPYNLPFMSGPGKTLGDIFNSPIEGVTIEKQMLFVGSHFVTYHQLKHEDKCVWTYWGEPLIFYDKEVIDGPDNVYYLCGKEVGRSAFLQISKYYRGIPDGIFANDCPSKMRFIHKDENFIKFSNWMFENDARYLAYYDLGDRLGTSYVLLNSKHG